MEDRKPISCTSNLIQDGAYDPNDKKLINIFNLYLVEILDSYKSSQQIYYKYTKYYQNPKHLEPNVIFTK